MAPRTLPGKGLSAFETSGTSGWNTWTDVNWRTVSAWLQARVDSVVATVPGSPTNGDMHILTSAPNQNALAIRDNGAWVYLTPEIGHTVYDEDTERLWTFYGTEWLPEYETGSNANGSFIKYADGRLECESLTLSADVTTAAGSMFRSAAATWTLPEAMVNSGFSVYPTTISNAATHWGSARPVTGSTVDYVIYSFGSYAGRNIRLTARGRWY